MKRREGYEPSAVPGLFGPIILSIFDNEEVSQVCLRVRTEVVELLSLRLPSVILRSWSRVNPRNSDEEEAYELLKAHHRVIC